MIYKYVNPNLFFVFKRQLFVIVCVWMSEVNDNRQKHKQVFCLFGNAPSTHVPQFLRELESEESSLQLHF